MVLNDVPFRDAIPTTTCVVLYGRGFVGRSLVTRLLTLGNWIVRVADSSQSIQLDHSGSDFLLADALSSGRAEYYQVDVRDVSQIKKALGGAAVVFYMDPSQLDMHDLYNCYMILVQGAKNVINACRECKVRRLVYNSTADIAFDGARDIHGGDESLICSWKFQDMFCDLKAQAEALVLFANNVDGLLTCALRPSNVFGPGDTQLVPLLVKLAKCGWSKFILGTGENMSDFTYVENVSHAHVCAAEALDSQMVSVAGKAFFITNFEPMKFWQFVSRILEGLGYQRPFLKVPSRVVWYIVSLVKWTVEKSGVRLHNHPLSESYIVHLALRTRTFNCNAARKHIGYVPIVPLEEGILSTIKSFSHLARDSTLANFRDFDEKSKAERLLGGGKVADILLWKDEKKTFICFLATFLLFYWFFLCGRTLTTSVAKLLLMVAISLFGYGILPSNLFGFHIQRISFSCFEIPEALIKDSVATLASLWNRGFRNIRSLAKGEDWTRFFKVAAFIYLAKLVILPSLTMFTGLALVFAFTAFFFYEQYESEIDALAELLLNCLKRSKGLLIRNLPPPVISFLQYHGLLLERKAPAVVRNR